MKKMMLRETQAPYTLAVDEETWTREPVILERDGQPVAALVPIAEYKAFCTWQQAQERRRHRQTQLEAFEQERAAFDQLESKLLRTHQGQVVQEGTDIAKVLDAVHDQFGYVPCYVQQVEEIPRVYKFPHREVVC